MRRNYCRQQVIDTYLTASRARFKANRLGYLSKFVLNRAVTEITERCPREMCTEREAHSIVKILQRYEGAK